MRPIAILSPLCLVIALGACSTPSPQTPQPREVARTVRPSLSEAPSLRVDAESTSGIKAVGVHCPYQPAPRFPLDALKQNITGTVVAIAHVKDGSVVDVKFLSGPEVYYPAVESAMKQYKCEHLEHDVYAQQAFEVVRID